MNTMETPNLTKNELINLLKERNLFSSSIERAIEQAENSHKNQTRDDGQPYLEEHVFPITQEIVLSYEDSPTPEAMIAAALLHDAVEDDPEFTIKMCEDNFGEKVAIIVDAVTKTATENSDDLSEEEKTTANKRNLDKIEQTSKEAILIKLSDRFNNISCVDKLKELKPEKYKRYIDETTKYFLPVAQKYSPYFYEKIKAELDKNKIV